MIFEDPKLIINDKPYGPTRYKQIVRECYIISKNCNTSYTDLMEITPAERNYLKEFITEVLDKSIEAVNKVRSNNN